MSDDEKKKDPFLEDTGEMERARPPGFVKGPIVQSIDPWNDVTPQELSGEEPALVVTDVHEVVSATISPAVAPTEDLYMGDGPFASPVDQPSEKVMRIADPRSPSAISRFALAASALSAP